MTKGMANQGECFNKNPPIITKIIYIKRTTHPCQVTGNPHPIPYLIAGNQISLSFLLIRFLHKLAIHPT